MLAATMSTANSATSSAAAPTAATSATSAISVQPAAVDIPGTVARLRSYFGTHATKPYEWRRRQLEGLLALVTEHEAALLEALHVDLHKPTMEAGGGELVSTTGAIRDALSQLQGWMKPESVHTPIALQPASSYIVREPYGVLLLIAPFNYPVSLALLPLLAALAAGNAVLLKPSELTPSVSAALARLIPQYVDREAVAVVEGGVLESTLLLRERWDYIFFTGSETVGKVVARAAAEHLTPVTLELGGKSPVIVDKDADVALAARRVMWGKTFNVGQTCIAPDHTFVHASIKQQYLTALAACIDTFYGADARESADLARIVSTRHTARLGSILDAHAADVVKGGRYDIEARWVEPTILDLHDKPQGRAMQEELFGPVLPVIGFTELSSVLQHINAQPKPLALYLFTKSHETQQRVMDETSSGALVINDTLYADTCTITRTHRERDNTSSGQGDSTSLVLPLTATTATAASHVAVLCYRAAGRVACTMPTTTCRSEAWAAAAWARTTATTATSS